jgi:hypothetical protein
LQHRDTRTKALDPERLWMALTDTADLISIPEANKLNVAALIGPFFRRRGGEPGDYLVVDFDLQAREAMVHIGDAGLLDGFQGSEETVAVQ